MIDGHNINDIENTEMVFGEGEGAAGGVGASFDGIIKSLPSIENTNLQFDYNYYCALAASQLFSLVDMQQYPNSDDIANKIVNRTEIFAKKVAKKWPKAFINLPDKL